jgi:hypothetical protein
MYEYEIEGAALIILPRDSLQYRSARLCKSAAVEAVGNLIIAECCRFLVTHCLSSKILRLV